MRKPYIYAKFEPGNYRAAIEFAREMERRDFPGVMIASHADRATSHADNITLALAILQQTERIQVGTGIASIYLRHPHSTASAASMIEELYPGRFLLGLGVSHVPMHEAIGVQHGKPLQDMRTYVETLHSASEGGPLPRIIVAAMRKRMARLAAEISDGVMWSNAPRSHIEQSVAPARETRSTGLMIGTSIPACFSHDSKQALEAARYYLHFYLQLPNYQKYYEEAGHGDVVAAARDAIERDDDAGVLTAASDSFVRDIALAGDAAFIREGVEDWYDAGLDFPVLDPVSTEGNSLQATWDLMNAFTDV